ncbi:carboxylate/amino acid/amine transporter [Malonomonas rubra DSM 5091]|uniref:Carboxylate/amino acid/amine transporter n=2 Tax=Malonomonas rubra TaxID=57040 RepID=A0A1M6NQM1_MALRU|nr:carboxylate/amino acid/amine transporter [Malonomonas rubra]AAC45409.1 MadN [Malonomonas rubra]SHJ97974.1 carboxylate/amino acid/amine transporter [Malonomonas rubra DSM 5091]
MPYLTIMTFVWAFSFSLIGVYLAGQVDAYFSVLIRVSLAALVFLPFMRSVSLKIALKLMVLGGIQLGCMYVFYYQSFLLLTVPEVLIFTILTPIYVTLIFDLMQGCFSHRYLLTAVLAVVGAFIIRYSNVGDNVLAGFFVVQGANICFALGQVGYKLLIEREKLELSQRSVFGYFYLGALIIASTAWAIFGNPEKLPATSLQWGILVYLGVIASGIGYFLWNKGATKVDTGVLAIMNNALIPAGLIVNLLIWNRDADLVRLFIGGSIIALSLILHEFWGKTKKLRFA